MLIQLRYDSNNTPAEFRYSNHAHVLASNMRAARTLPKRFVYTLLTGREASFVSHTTIWQPAKLLQVEHTGGAFLETGSLFSTHGIRLLSGTGAGKISYHLQGLATAGTDRLEDGSRLIVLLLTLMFCIAPGRMSPRQVWKCRISYGMTASCSQHLSQGFDGITGHEITVPLEHGNGSTRS
jgi:hypothetical protein